MRKLTAAVLVAGAATMAVPAMAADLTFYPPIIDIPDVNQGYSGSFYLRGSVGLNLLWAKEINHPSNLPATTTTFPVDSVGYGHSFGAGAGYETGTGFRFDATIDSLSNNNMTATIAGSTNLTNGPHKLALRSTVILANAYYDFGFGSGGYGAAGGTFGYVGAGAGIAFNDVITTGSAVPDTRGYNASFAGAGMVGVGYDFGQVVADLGYRALYINKIENTAATHPYSIGNNWVHEVRGTVRYRFN